MPFFSPRLMGEGAYYTGKAAKGAESAPLRITVGATRQAGKGSSYGGPNE